MDDISVEVCGENVAWYKVCIAKRKKLCVLVNKKKKKKKTAIRNDADRFADSFFLFRLKFMC